MYVVQSADDFVRGLPQRREVAAGLGLRAEVVARRPETGVEQGDLLGGVLHVEEAVLHVLEVDGDDLAVAGAAVVLVVELARGEDELEPELAGAALLGVGVQGGEEVVELGGEGGRAEDVAHPARRGLRPGLEIKKGTSALVVQEL